MKKYSVQIAKTALIDIENIYTHIADVLLAPENAIRQYNRLKEAILKLDMFPERYHILDLKTELKYSIRRMPVDNYSVFYIIKNDAVVVTNVLYSRSNIEEIFGEQL